MKEVCKVCGARLIHDVRDTFRPSEAVRILGEIEDFETDRDHAEAVLMNCLSYLGYDEVAEAFFEATNRSLPTTSTAGGGSELIDLGDVSTGDVSDE